MTRKKKPAAGPVQAEPTAKKRICYVCEDGLLEEQDVFRVIARGDRKGDRIGPLCTDCVQHMERHVLLEPVEG